MRKIIESKVYNTETAKEVESWWNGLSNSDFNYVSETLYITKSGNYFLYGEGGALSNYSKVVGNSSSGSQEIFPFSRQEAFEWLQKHNFIDELEKNFSEMIEEA